jgi:tRNA threonylcarbamoyladenosine biosynthesis protein TsaE
MAPEGNALTCRDVGLNDLRRVAEDIVSSAAKVNVWLFHGEMGAGKTTLIKMIGKVLGVDDSITSPTFSIVNEYQASDQKKVFHFDFYRIKNENEAYDIGVEEYFYSGHYCFVEWPEKIPGILPERKADINITIEDNTHRTIVVSVS